MCRILQNIYSIPIRTRAECIIAFQYLQCVPKYDSNVIRKVSNMEDIFWSTPCTLHLTFFPITCFLVSLPVMVTWSWTHRTLGHHLTRVPPVWHVLIVRHGEVPIILPLLCQCVPSDPTLRYNNVLMSLVVTGARGPWATILPDNQAQ